MNPQLEIFFQLFPWLDNQANASLMRGETLEELVSYAKTASGIEVIPSYATKFPEYLHQAGRTLALERTLARYLARERESLLHEFGKDAAKHENATNVELRVYLSISQERKRIQDEICRGQSIFSMRDAYGIAKQYDSRTGQKIVGCDSQGLPRLENPNENWWEIVDIETLRAVHAQILQERALREGTVEDIRLAARNGKTRMDTGDSPFRSVVNVQDKKGKSQQQQQQEPPVDDNYVLRHPDTDEPFDKRTLVRFLNSGDARNARRILVRNGRIHKPAELAMLRLLGKR